MTTKKTTAPVEPTVTLPDPVVSPDSPRLLDVGYDFNALLREEPQDVAVTYALLQDPGPQLDLGHHGYLRFGGGLLYRPTGFDLNQDAVLCVRVH